MTELLLGLLKTNLAAASAVLVLVVLRRPLRRMIGSLAVYRLWLLVPAAALGALAPARVSRLEVAAPAGREAAIVANPAGLELIEPILAGPAPFSPEPLIASIWIVGAVCFAFWLGRRQAVFLADLRRGRAGPAVVGVLRPRIVAPDDFAQRFTRREQTVVLAHEKIHLARQDARINALVALIRCLCWFNPLIHIGAHVMRIDQEMACDALVLARHPKARRPYAEALLKAQMAARPLPLGCYWPAGTLHPLTERIVMLNRTKLTSIQRLAGAAAVAALVGGAGVAAWAAQPVRTEIVLAAAPEPAPRPASVAAPTLEPAEGDAVSATAQVGLTNAPAPTWADFEDIPEPLRVGLKVEDLLRDHTGVAFNRGAPMSVRGQVLTAAAAEGGGQARIRVEAGGRVQDWMWSGSRLEAERLRANLGATVEAPGFQRADRRCINTLCFLTASGAVNVVAPSPGTFAPPRQAVVSLPEWVAQPTAEDLRAAYPPAALEAGTRGVVNMTCLASETGELTNCAVAYEPPGQGFGAAAMSLTGKYRMKTTTSDGLLLGGARVNVAIQFAPERLAAG